MSVEDELAEAAKACIDFARAGKSINFDRPTDPYCNCPACDLIAALARYDAAKDVREAEQQVVAASIVHVKRIREYVTSASQEAVDKLLAARKALEVKHGD